MAITHLKQEPIRYKVTHPAYGDNVIYESWIELCNKSIDIAQDAIRLALIPEFKERTVKLCDEMLETAEEIDV